MGKKLIAANWKMNKTQAEAAGFVRSLKRFMDGFGSRSALLPEIAVFPPFTSIAAVQKEAGNSAVTVGAQDVFYEEKGAYTGEISCAMLADAGCEAVITGHSERRHILGESDDVVAEKTKAVVNSGMKVVLCVGETAEQREIGDEKQFVKQQLAAVLSRLSGFAADSLMVAYEPVWAIGTGKNAEVSQIEQMHGAVRETVSGILGQSADGVRILYGGSVTPQNASRIARAENVDGMLVGTASLELKSFTGIIEAAVSGNL